jgi:hypothetical protein
LSGLVTVSGVDALDTVSALNEDVLDDELYRLEERPRVSGAGAGLSESAANRTVSGRTFDNESFDKESIRAFLGSDAAGRDNESFRGFVVSAKGNLKVSAGWLSVSGTVGFEAGC